MSKINMEVRYPSHQDDARHYDTATLRKHYLVEKIMAPDEINMCYSMFDRDPYLPRHPPLGVFHPAP